MGVTSTIAGVAMVGIAVWWYIQYKKSPGVSTADAMWRSSRVMSTLAIVMMVFVWCLVQVSR